METKIKVLQNIVETAEETSKDYTFDGKWIHDAVVSKFRSSPLPGQDPTKFEKECDAYLKKMQKTDVFNISKHNDISRTAVHVNVESFKCGKSCQEITLVPATKTSFWILERKFTFWVLERKLTFWVLKRKFNFPVLDNAVLRDFEWSGNERIEKMFKSNQAFDPSLVRQYLGTYSGLTRMLPSIKWKAEPAQVTMDLFDPRYRPWFIGAETAPKDIVFLID